MAKGKHEISVEELVARLSDEVKRLQENARSDQAPLPPQLAIPVLPEGEQLLRYEQLLSNMLRKSQPTNWLGRIMMRLFPQQISHNLLATLSQDGRMCYTTALLHCLLKLPTVGAEERAALRRQLRELNAE